MHWMLVKKEMTIVEMDAILQSLFPELHFHHLDESTSDWFESPYFHCRDFKNFTYSIRDWTENLKSNIDFHDLEDKKAIRMTQYIGQYISKKFNTIVITDCEGLHNPYHALMIEKDSLLIIDDDGIEENNYKYKKIKIYNHKIQSFNKHGAPQ